MKEIGENMIERCVDMNIEEVKENDHRGTGEIDHVTVVKEILDVTEIMTETEIEIEIETEIETETETEIMTVIKKVDGIVTRIHPKLSEIVDETDMSRIRIQVLTL